MLDLIPKKSQPGGERTDWAYYGIKVELLYENKVIPFVLDDTDPEARFPTDHLDLELINPESLQDLHLDDLHIRLRRAPSHSPSQPSAALWLDSKVDLTPFRGLLMREGELERVFKLEAEPVEQPGEGIGSDDEEGLDGRFRIYEEEERVRRLVLEMYEGSVVPMGRTDPRLAHYNGDIPLDGFVDSCSEVETPRPRGRYTGKDVTFLPRYGGQEADCTWTFHLTPAEDSNTKSQDRNEPCKPIKSDPKSRTIRQIYHTRTKTPVMSASTGMVIGTIEPIPAGTMSICTADASEEVISPELIRTEIPCESAVNQAMIAGTDNTACRPNTEKEDAKIEEESTGAELILPPPTPLQPPEAGLSGKATDVSDSACVASTAAKCVPGAELSTDLTNNASKATDSDPPDSVQSHQILPQSRLPVSCDSRPRTSVSDPPATTESAISSVLPTFFVGSPTAQPQISNGTDLRDNTTPDLGDEDAELKPSEEFLLARLEELVQQAASQEASPPSISGQDDKPTHDTDHIKMKEECASHGDGQPEPNPPAETEVRVSSHGATPTEQKLKQEVEDEGYGRYVLVPSSTSPPPSNRRSRTPRPGTVADNAPLAKPSKVKAKDKHEDRYRSGKRQARGMHTGSTASNTSSGVVEKDEIAELGQSSATGKERRSMIDDTRPKKRSRLCDIPMWTNIAPSDSATAIPRASNHSKDSATASAKSHYSAQKAHRSSMADKYRRYDPQSRGHQRGLRGDGQDRPRAQESSGHSRTAGPPQWPLSTLVRRGADHGPTRNQREIIDLTISDTSEEAHRDRERRKRKRDREEERYRTRKDGFHGKYKRMEEPAKGKKRVQVDKGLKRRDQSIRTREVIDLTED